jgi:hypothetical protein
MPEWVVPWLEELTSMHYSQKVLRVRLHISSPESEEEVRHADTGVLRLELRAGRCAPLDIIDEEVLDQVGAMVVTVCGPSTYSESVKEAVRSRVDASSLDFFEELFSY